MKKIHILFLVLFAACIAVPLFCFNFQKDAVSEITNSKLTELDFSNGVSLPNIESYINDRIGLRDEALNFYQVFNDRVFGEMVHPSYCYGKDGYVFRRIGATAVDEKFVAEFCNYLARIQAYCEERGVPFIYGVTPSKSTVYSQYLPDGYIYDNKFLACLYENLERCGINYVDNAAYLTEIAKQEQIYNQKYDANHWNDLGEFYGMNHLLEEVRRDFPSVQLLQFSDYNITQEEMTSLPVSHFAISEMVPSFKYAHADEMTYLTEQFRDIRLNEQHRTFSVVQTDRTDEALPSVLFFHGSYFNRNMGMFNFAFGQECSVHNYQNILDFEYYFNIFQPDCVIFETAEYATTSTYFDLEKMSSKTLNAPLESCDLSLANTIHVSRGVADGLSALQYRQSEGSRLVTMTASAEPDIRFGYYVSGGTTYDLEISDGAISLTADVERTDLRDGTIYLFK